MISCLVKSKVLLSNQYDLKSIKTITAIGDKVLPRIFQEFKKSLPSTINVLNVYGNYKIMQNILVKKMI